MDDLTNDYAEVRAVKELKALSVRFVGFTPLAAFKATIEYEFRLIEHYGLTKAFIDLRSVKVYDEGAPEYVKDVWFPKAIALGIKSVAFVQPQAALGKLSMARAHQQEEKKSVIAMQHFGDPDEAWSWLKSQ